MWRKTTETWKMTFPRNSPTRRNAIFLWFIPILFISFYTFSINRLCAFFFIAHTHPLVPDDFPSPIIQLPHCTQTSKTFFSWSALVFAASQIYIIGWYSVKLIQITCCTTISNKLLSTLEFKRSWRKKLKTFLTLCSARLWTGVKTAGNLIS